jgi:hypothetical protein
MAGKPLGVWSTIDGNDAKHISKNIMGRFISWTSKMTNRYLLARLGWITYKFKLWPGIQYGLATLAMPLETAQSILRKENFKILPFLGINNGVHYIKFSGFWSI